MKSHYQRTGSLGIVRYQAVRGDYPEGRLSLDAMKRQDGDLAALFGWSLSTVIHGGLLAIVVAFNFHSTLVSAPPKRDVFRWQVALSEAPQVQALASEGVRQTETVDSESLAVPTSVLSTGSEDASSISEAPSSISVSTQMLSTAMALGHTSIRQTGTHVGSVSTPVMRALSNPIPPPAIEAQQNAERVQIAREPETQTIIQRPRPVVHEAVSRRVLPDYSWLMEELRLRLEQVKTYPVAAKSARVQGRVLVQVQVQSDGRLLGPEIEESSGHPVLDQAALEALQAISPIHLAHTLQDEAVVMLVPLNYQLE